jgi:hypothetical protein
MANALRKSQKQKENPVENTDITSTTTPTFVPEVNKPYIPPSKEDISLSPVSQLGSGITNSTQNKFNPIVNPSSTNQSILNGNDTTNIAVKYAQINNISKDLVSDSPINQKSEYYKQLDPLWREKALSKEKDKKELWEKEHGAAYREDVQSKLKRRGGKKRWEMSAGEVKKEKKYNEQYKKASTKHKKSKNPIVSPPISKSTIDVFNADIDPLIKSSVGPASKKPEVIQEKNEQKKYLDSIKNNTNETPEAKKSGHSTVSFTPWKAHQSNTKSYLKEFTQTYK